MTDIEYDCICSLSNAMQAHLAALMQAEHKGLIGVIDHLHDAIYAENKRFSELYAEYAKSDVWDKMGF